MPAKHSRAAIDTMSAMRSVERTPAANLVMGRAMFTWGRSCSEPILCWVSAPCPPMCSTGLSERNAVAIPVSALVKPGPAVVITHPSPPVWRAYPSAAWAATCSCRTSMMRIPSSMHPS